jgi:TatD-related deoxyribonuclease
MIATVFDNHMHLRAHGDYASAIEKFKMSGGTHLNFCPYSDMDRVVREQSYAGCFRDGIDLKRRVEKDTGIPVFVTCGPYPVDYLALRETIGRQAAVEVMRRGMEEAQHLCFEKEAIAIGEIGRPHFPTDDTAIADCNELLVYGMTLAKEVSVPVIIHMESATPENMAELAAMAHTAGLPAERVIKHYAPPLVTERETHGVFPSVIASEKNMRVAFAKGTRFMLETDFLDDPGRPGAVLALHTIPKKLSKLLRNGDIGEKQALAVVKENPEAMYGISLDD